MSIARYRRKQLAKRDGALAPVPTPGDDAPAPAPGPDPTPAPEQEPGSR